MSHDDRGRDWRETKMRVTIERLETPLVAQRLGEEPPCTVLLEVTLLASRVGDVGRGVCCPATCLVEIHYCSPGSRKHLRKRKEARVSALRQPSQQGGIVRHLPFVL